MSSISPWNALLRDDANATAEGSAAAPLGSTMQAVEDAPTTPYVDSGDELRILITRGRDDPEPAALPAQSVPAAPDYAAAPASNEAAPYITLALEQGTQPQQAAKNRELYEKTGIDTTGAPEAAKVLETQALVSSVLESLANAPKASQFMANEQNSAVAADLAPEVVSLERSWNDAFSALSQEDRARVIDPPSLLADFGGDLAGVPFAVAAAVENVEANRLSSQQGTSELGLSQELTSTQKARLDWIGNLRQPPEARTTAGKYVQMAAQQLPVLGSLFLAGGEKAAIFGGIGAAIGFSFGPGGAARGAQIGASYGGKAGMTLEAFTQLSGEARREFLKDRDLASNPLDRELVNKSAMVVGVLAAGAEVLGGYAVGKMMADSLRQALTKKLATRATREVLADAFKGQFVAALTEGGTEGLQEAIKIAATHIQREIQGGDWADISWESIGERLLDAVISGAVVSVGIGTGAQALPLAMNIRQAAEAQKHRDNVVKVIEAHRDSELNARSPSAAKDLLNTLNQSAEPILIEPSALSLELGSQGINPVSWFESIGVSTEALDKAIKEGQDVEVDAAILVSALADSNVAELVADNIRAEPSAPTTSEVALRTDAVRQRINEAVRLSAETGPTPESTELADNIAQQLVATGKATEADAVMIAAVWESLYRMTKDAADKEGKDFNPQEFFEGLGLDIRTPEQAAQEEAAAAQAEQAATEALDPLNQSQDWRDAEVQMPMDTGEVATVPAGVAIDSIHARLDAAEQLARCVRGS